jgi:acyl carrier protein
MTGVREAEPAALAAAQSGFVVVRDVLIDRGVAAEAIVPEATLETLGVDSLDAVELLFQIEMRVPIRFPDSRAGVASVADLAALIDRLRSDRGSGTARAAGLLDESPDRLGSTKRTEGSDETSRRAPQNRTDA